MKIEYVSLTIDKSCTGFKSSIPTGLPDYHPTTFEKGIKGCVGIFREEDGSFNVLGENGQHFWISAANTIWGRKANNPQDGVKYEKPVQEIPKPPEPGKIQESDSLLTAIMARTEEPVKSSQKKLLPGKPLPVRGRPRK